MPNKNDIYLALLRGINVGGKNKVNSERKYDIIFLRQTIDYPKLVHDLEPQPGIEELHYRPGVLFWAVNRRDFSKSKMSKIVGTALHQEMTVRGPSTTRKVYELMSTLSESHGSNLTDK